MSRHRNGGSDLLVVGGGVIGLAVARAVQARGMRVRLLERGRCGREASWAAAGMLSPLGEALEPGPFLRFALESLRAYGGFAAELESETGIQLEYREGGKLRLALSAAEETRLRGRLDWARQEGFGARWLEPEEVRRAEPEVAPEVRGALLLDEDYRIDNRALVAALVASARARGVDVREDAPVRRVVAREGRVRGVVLDGGASIEAHAVLLAGGAWTGGMEGLPTPVPVRPVRGQMVALRAEGPRSGRVLECDRIYLVPRDDGRLLLGATVEEVGFRAGTTAGGLSRLLEAALRLVPSLDAAPIVETWSGFRPGTPDGMPILGEHPLVHGLYLATGHFRNGILLTPATAAALAAAIAGEPGPKPPPEFAPGRFADEAAPQHDHHRQEMTR